MAHLVVQIGNKHQRTIELDVPRLVVGRGESAQLQLEERVVSREHCTIEESGSEHLLRDLDSSSGTWVNGERIGTVYTLKHGDRIELGKHTLLYERSQLEAGPSTIDPDATAPGERDASSAAFWTKGLQESKKPAGLTAKARKPSSSRPGSAAPWDGGGAESAAQLQGALGNTPEQYARTMAATDGEFQRLRELVMTEQQPHLSAQVKGERKLLPIGKGFTVGFHDGADFRLPGSKWFGKEQFLVKPDGQGFKLTTLSFWANVSVDGARLRGTAPIADGAVIAAAGTKFKFKSGT